MDMEYQNRLLMVKFGFSIRSFTALVLSTVIIFLEFLVHGFIMVLIIWYLVQSYTQYIPLSVSELDSWLQTPSIYVFDCSAAGMIVNAFTEVCNAWLVHRQA